MQRKVALGYRSLGPQTLKNIPDPLEVFAIHGDGMATSDDRQEIRYCRTADGVRLGYAISGDGPPLVKAGNWLSHLEYDWDNPVWRPFLLKLSKNHRLIRYDPRGTGLSIGMLQTYRLMRGRMIWRQWSTQLASSVFRYSVYRRVAPSLSPMRCGILSGSRISFYAAASLSAGTGVLPKRASAVRRSKH